MFFNNKTLVTILTYMENIIKDIRKRNNLTQIAFAKKIGVSRSAIALIETGINNISQELFQKIKTNFTLTNDEIEIFENAGVNVGVKTKTSNIINNNSTESYIGITESESDFLIASYEELTNIEDYLQVICSTLFAHTHYEFAIQEAEQLNKLQEMRYLMLDLMFDKKKYTKEHFKLIKSSIALGKELLDGYITELKYTLGGSVSDYKNLLIDDTIS